MRLKIVFFFAAVCCMVSVRSQKLTVVSPNQKIIITLFSQQNEESGEWCLKNSYSNKGIISEAIPRIDLSLSRSDQYFSKELKCLKANKSLVVNEQYTALHGKRSLCSKAANEVIVSFENPSKAKLNIIIRAYNDGITFRYGFPEKQGSFTMKDEFTSFGIAKETTRWMEKRNPANEGLYTAMSDDKIQKQEWCYPALFKLKDSSRLFFKPGNDLSFIGIPAPANIARPVEDEGDNYNYEKGIYSVVSFSWNEKLQTVTTGNLQGSYAGALKKGCSILFL